MCWQKSAGNATKNVIDFVKRSDFFSNHPRKKIWPDGEKQMPFPDSAVQKYPKSVVEI